MPVTAFSTSSFVFEAGPLGFLRGLELRKDQTISQSPVLRYFGGVAYAHPPLGEYRFRRARPLPYDHSYGSLSHPGDHTNACGVCPQPGWGDSLQTQKWNEDCLQLNIYLPTDRAPPTGWPVFFFIHGGFLQWGDPNTPPDAIAPLLSETSFRAIIVMPAYRLNAFGFLSSRELTAEANRFNESTGNMGFWDQRLALEWVGEKIKFFGGDPDNITIAGYSAGAHSTFHQLAHELYRVPEHKALIKRAIMWSNSPGVQPKALTESQLQFDQVLQALNIPLHLSAGDKLARLRATPVKDLVSIQHQIPISEFRALSDDAFVATNLIANINSGDFARRMRSRGIKLMNGECRDEHHLYRAWRTPKDSYQDMRRRLCADYPEQVVNRLCAFYCGRQAPRLPARYKDWIDLFGHLYAKMQVHCLERGFHDALARGGMNYDSDVVRYRIEWRISGLDKQVPPEWEVTHGTDMFIWFWGLSVGLNEHEKYLLQPWNEAFAAFVETGDTTKWSTGTNDPKLVKRLTTLGSIDVWPDDTWHEGVRLWKQLSGAPRASSLFAWIRSRL